MILAQGKIYETESQNEILEGLPEILSETLQNQTLDREVVIAAFDALSKKVKNGELNELLGTVELDGLQEYVEMAAKMMSREYLEYKISMELGENRDREPQGKCRTGEDIAGEDRHARSSFGRITTKRVPLGVLFHIAAGNMDALPIVSVAEGLLAGNINILKLPRVDKGLTVLVMKMLVDFEPKLKDFVYIFDTPSSDVIAMKKMADMSDGIVVWGGDEAIKAVRAMSKPGTRLIEWGHKLGFCYVSGYEQEEKELTDLAEHIMQTKQLLCSSCQVIYIDTEDSNEIKEFSQKFLSYLEKAAVKYPITEIGASAELTLRRYVAKLERALETNEAASRVDGIAAGVTTATPTEEVVYQGKHTSVTAKFDSKLELSYMYGNCIVKPLLHKNLAKVLRESKEYLQTAGLICEKSLRKEITDIILKTGVERVTYSKSMSNYFDGEAHDGEYPLLRYTRIVNVEI